MLERDIVSRGVRDARVLRAMRDLPREAFLPEDLRGYAYEDRPLPIGLEQTISQPYIVAVMTELLRPRPGDSILEIGTGSGYQAAVLSRLVQQVWTVEIVRELADRARLRLEQEGCANVAVRVGDGYAGWPERAPFDGIIVTCGAEAVPAPLTDQLRSGGVLVIPVGPSQNVQVLKTIEKRPDGSLIYSDVMPVRFVPLTGAHGRT